MTALVIAGTGTGVGKTVVTACLTNFFLKKNQSVCVYKPVQTGTPKGLPPEDIDTIQHWLFADSPPDSQFSGQCTYCLEAPAAPWVADCFRGTQPLPEVPGTIDPNQLVAVFQDLERRYDCVLVETAGGLRVPITQTWDTIALIQALGVPVILVTSPILGSINHTLLSYEAMVRADICVQGLVVSNYCRNEESLAVDTFPAVIQALLPKSVTIEILPLLPLGPACFQTAVFQDLVAGKFTPLF
ncbi:MAG: dethiobiotin synthase [Cyanobacteria bacterium P01_H01_bin.74]